MKIDVVAWGNAIGGLSFKAGRKEGAITAKSFTYSEPIAYSGPRILQIHQSGSGAVDQAQGTSTPEDQEHQSHPLPLPGPESGAAAPQTPLAKELAKRRKEDASIVALVPLPTNTRRATVLLAPAAAGTYQGYVIDDDPSKLPVGKLRVHNLAPMPIAMQFSGGQRKEMRPRETFLVNPSNGAAVYRLAYRAGDEWKIQESNIIRVRPDEQTQFIVLKSSNQFFLSADGSSGGYLQLVTLRRQAE